MALTFRKATREQAKARVALIGPAGSGKSMSALIIAHGLGQRVAVIDSERGSASKYAGYTDPRSSIRFDFDVLELESFAPERYVEAIKAAESAGYDVLVIDSLSHAWSGKDGALEQVDKVAARSRSRNSFAAWREVTPMHNRLVDALVSCSCHLIVTMRSKTEYVLEDVERNGKTSKEPRKIGMAPIQRDGLEFEFDVVGDIDLDHRWVISKTRCPAFDGAVIDKPGMPFAEAYKAWLSDGVAPAERKPASVPPPAPQRQRSEPPPRNGKSATPDDDLVVQLTASLIAELNKQNAPQQLKDWADRVTKLPKESRAPLWAAFGDRCKELNLDPGKTARGEAVAS